MNVNFTSMTTLPTCLWSNLFERRIHAILYEMAGASESIAKKAMRLAAYKMPVKTRFITRKEKLN